MNGLFALALRNLGRNRRRSLLTMAGIAVAVFIYAALSAAVEGITAPVGQAAHGELLSVREKSRANVLTSRLPQVAEARAARQPGVQLATGVLTDLAIVGEKDVHIFLYGVDPEPYLAAKRLTLDAAQRAAFAADRNGAVVGHLLAERMGWKLGQRVDLPSHGLAFTVRALLPAQDSELESQVLLQRDYLQKARGAEDLVTTLLVRVADGQDPNAVAHRLDEHFALTPTPTETASEAAYAQRIVDQFMGFVDYVRWMGLITVLITLMAAANTVSLNVRERMAELGVMRALGYRPGQLLALIVIEACALALPAGVLGLGLAWGMLGSRAASLSGLQLSDSTLLYGLVASLLVGIAGSVVPALSASRTPIIDALRTVD